MNTSFQNWLSARRSGVLAHVSSLPGAFGIGNLGPGARAFVDLLAECGFGCWQICPLGPTGYGDSPYQSFSSFAGNAYFIDLDELVAAGLLAAEECSSLRALPQGEVDYGMLHERFWPVLALAHERFLDSGADLPGCGSFTAFCLRHASWLQVYADFMALKKHFGGRPWYEWPARWRDWSPEIEATLPESAHREAQLHAFAQYVFFGQWERLRAHAAKRGIHIIGDVPIFVAHDSADAWRWREVLRLDSAGRRLASAGVPPDYFSERGQCWGNPLYDWDHLARTGYAWWIERLRAAMQTCDIVRLDHFRGFDTYWEIPGESDDAREGRWLSAPGHAFFGALKRALPEAKLIAEDLGYITAEVVALRRAVGYPGMRILQFAYGHDDNNVNLPHFVPRDSVVYTGTHDNTTTRGWLESLEGEVARKVDAYFGLDGSRSAWPIMRAAFATVAPLVVLPLQDLLDLPAEARMNRPGTADGNWKWRVLPGQLSALLHDQAERLREWHDLFDRKGDPRQRDYSAPPEHVPATATTSETHSVHAH
ncbi:4-alpha-glucanotransferase [Congregicoccus parvus]|uniref:4-alpha-glucanotransferase n=1 Tax=Congregicoccus parvus TaxID=3081749 RepID=UPI003FA567BD